MKRFNISLPDDLYRRLRRYAFEISEREEKRVSYAEIMRRALEKYLAKS